jgi:hypothetical protein
MPEGRGFESHTPVNCLVKTSRRPFHRATSSQRHDPARRSSREQGRVNRRAFETGPRVRVSPNFPQQSAGDDGSSRPLSPGFPVHLGAPESISWTERLDVAGRSYQPRTPPICGGFHGASRTRTGALLGAIQSPYAGGNRMVERLSPQDGVTPNTFPNTLQPVLH